MIIRCKRGRFGIHIKTASQVLVNREVADMTKNIDRRIHEFLREKFEKYPESERLGLDILNKRG